MTPSSPGLLDLRDTGKNEVCDSWGPLCTGQGKKEDQEGQGELDRCGRQEREGRLDLGSLPS